ncbi:MAG: ferrochelatase [Actinomycetota bacterium]
MKTAVLVMAYGSPTTLDDVKAYYTDIRRGRPPSAEALADLTGRYRSIGGTSQLTDITHAQAGALEHLLEEVAPDSYNVYVGMKHWHPYIAEGVANIVADGLEDVVGLVLAPHFSSKSIGEYQTKVETAGHEVNLHMVSSWYDEPGFIALVASNIAASIEGWHDHRVFFTAHSLPQRILEEGDPYADQLKESAELIAKEADIDDWEVAWQSASHTGEPWIGPDILERLDAFRSEGGERALIAPIGFVSDHLEILYDVDIECVERAAQLGLDLRRINSPNDDPRFIQALANVVLRSSPSR